MYKPKRSPAAKIAVVLILILALSAATAYAMRPGDAAYTQILIGRSGSEVKSATEIAACAERAIDKAIEREETIDIAAVSGVPAAMGWRTIDARQSLWTRLTFSKAREERKLAKSEAMAAVRELMKAEQPPRSSDHFGALAESRARADGAARDAAAADRSTVVCSDGHWASDCGSAYKEFENEAVLRCLRKSGLVSDWDGAAIYFDASTVDEVADLPAPKEAAIRSFWGEWSRATGANLEYL